MSTGLRTSRPIAAEARDATAPARLVVKELTKTFGGHAAIAGVSLSLVEHEFAAVLGPSGAGKTTLFRCIAGLLAPDRGSVRVDDKEITPSIGRHRRQIAVIFQQFNLVNRLTALENVLAGRLGHVPAWRGCLRRFERSDRLLALGCLDRVGLLGQATQRADRLSGGQQQRVAIARALAQQPRLIVADEPIASLDPNSANNVMALLRGIAHSEGVAVICSLHQEDFARAYADRIIGLSRGRVVLAVAAAQFDRAASARLYGSSDAPLAPVGLTS